MFAAISCTLGRSQKLQLNITMKSLLNDQLKFFLISFKNGTITFVKVRLYSQGSKITVLFNQEKVLCFKYKPQNPENG